MSMASGAETVSRVAFRIGLWQSIKRCGIIFQKLALNSLAQLIKVSSEICKYYTLLYARQMKC
jgi:hypothetical protein